MVKCCRDDLADRPYDHGCAGAVASGALPLPPKPFSRAISGPSRSRFRPRAGAHGGNPSQYIWQALHPADSTSRRQYIPQAFLLDPDGKVIGAYLTADQAIPDIEKLVDNKKRKKFLGIF